MPSLRPIRFAAVALIAIATSGAGAEIHQVGNSVVNNNSQDPRADALALGTWDGTDRLAAIVAAIYPLDPTKPADKLIVGFYDKGDWEKFVNLWKKAIRARPPTLAESYKIDKNVPSYFDAATKAIISVEKDRDGDIDFTLAGKPDANVPTVLGIIRLRSSNFSDFDASVEAVTAYFSAK